MTEVLSLVSRDMETVSAPLHPHMSLDKPYRNSTGFERAPDGRHSPSPFRSAPGRKRAATINTADAERGMFEPLKINTTGSMAQEASRDIICLCTPAPKIPRPRNAFILYRQHHQSQVTADNPKLSNPEISKIIGDKWKHESEDIKENWKKLAEEEKQRHQHQYPNYRYQPRRGTKTQSNWASTSPTDEHGRCPKCHGRSISTPRTPSTPFATSPAGNYAVSSQSQPHMRRLDTSAQSRRSSFEQQSPTSMLPYPSHLPPVRDVEIGDPGSPETKRRRANNAGGYHAITGSGAYTTRPAPDMARTPPEGGPASLMRPYSGSTFPDLAALPRSHSGPMPPPLRPPGSSWVELEHPGRRLSGFDESLRLPPLQSAIPASPSRSPAVEGRHVGIHTTRLNVSPIKELLTRNTDEPSLKQKLDMLSNISQVALPVSRSNPRGAFIAVEGSNKTLLEDVGLSLEKGLIALGEVALKVWSNDTENHGATVGDPEMGHQTEKDASQRSDNNFSSCLETMLTWRQKAKQIAHHVTGESLGESSQDDRTEKDPKIVQAKSTEVRTPPNEGKAADRRTKTPVALVKGGFSLTVSDQFASTVPISDRYTPADHWRWMASLWRGTVNPDLVVCVNDSQDDESITTGTVDVSKRMGLIEVKVPKGKKLDEATERRMAFEVMEWLRDGTARDETSRSWRSDSL